MNDCPETELLVRWLNGQLDERTTAKFREHVGACADCQRCMEELTGDDGLTPPSNPGMLLDNSSSFTNEPHFEVLRKRLTDQVLNLEAEYRKDSSQTRKTKSPDVDPESLRDSAESLAIDADETVALDVEAPGKQLEKRLPIEIEGYRLEGLIGRGGFAEVYRGWEKQLERNVAIKVLDQNRINARNRHRFFREAKVASSIDSEHVVRVLTSGETASARPYIVMELVKGESLSAWIDSRSSNLDGTTINEGVKLLIQVCTGTTAVHDAGLVHRDIKPSNIFINAEKQAAKLGDFGLAQIVDEDTVTLTRAAELAGTPAYMSPEQAIAQGEVGQSADVYSLGATLYHLLTGQSPFRGSSLSILKQVTETVPISPRQLNESVSKDLETICLKALEKDPRRRYVSASLLADDLRNAIGGRPITARPLSHFGKLHRWANTHRALTATLGVLGIVLVSATLVSTTLWLNSEYHAKRSDESRTQLIASVKTMVGSSLKRKSSYMDMSGDDRTRAVQVVAGTYKMIFDTRVGDDIELVRELAVDLAEATEVNMELSAYARAGELLETNSQFVDALLTMPNPTEADRAVSAWFYNQLAEFLIVQQARSDAFQTGTAAWKVEINPDADAKTQTTEALAKAIALTANATDPVSELSLQHRKAAWRLVTLEEQDDESTAELMRMLDEVTEIRSDNAGLSTIWMSLHQGILKSLSKRSQGLEAIEYQLQRGTVYKEFIDYLVANGQETYWYERDAAVNDFFVGLGFLRIGEPLKARPLLNAAITRFEALVAAFPGNAQFGADLAEASLVVAENDWHNQDKVAAMVSYQSALDAFERCLKSDAGEISIRRRTGIVYELVASRHLELENFPAAAECFSRAAIHFLAAYESPYDPAARDQDKAMHDKMLQQADAALAKSD